MTNIKKVKTMAFQNIQPIVWSLMASVVFLLVFYIYAINQTVRNVAERQTIESELSHLSANIGESEFKYISLKNKIDLELAHSMGFEAVSDTKYVSRKSSVAVALELNSGRQ